MENKNNQNQNIGVTNNEAEYSRFSGLNKGMLVDFALRACFVARAKEMRAGYFNVSVSKDGEEKKEYVPDTRKTFISSVKGLISLLTPELMNEENINILNKIVELEKSSEKNFNEYCYEEKVLCRRDLKKTGKKFMPEEDEYIFIRIINSDGTKGIDKRKGVWNVNIRRYWDVEVEIYSVILSELNVLIHMENYFAEK